VLWWRGTFAGGATRRQPRSMRGQGKSLVTKKDLGKRVTNLFFTKIDFTQELSSQRIAKLND
jgi:hypothetical protein